MIRDEQGRFKKLIMPLKVDLERLYLEQNKPPCVIGQRFKVSGNTVRRWLQQYDIPVKRPYLSNVQMNLSEIEKAYLAGLLDGDGTINISLRKNNKSRRGLSPNYEISFATVYEEFVQKLQKLIGGNISSFIQKDSRYKKVVYKLGFTNQASRLAFLEAIAPYLILKKGRALLMIKFLKKRLKARAKKGNGAPISNESWHIIEKMRMMTYE